LTFLAGRWLTETKIGKTIVYGRNVQTVILRDVGCNRNKNHDKRYVLNKWGVWKFTMKLKLRVLSTLV